MKICIIGLGYIGLPTALLLSAHHEVVGCDINPALTEKINKRIMPFQEPEMGDLLKGSDLSVVNQPVQSDVFIVCVPTPFDKEIKIADLHYVKIALESIVPCMKKGNLIILESTVTPGTCKNFVRKILEKSGLNVGQDLFLAHCPERAIPGNTFHEMVHNDRIIGGINKESTEMTEKIYRSFVKGNIYKTDVTTAEFVKLMENTYRDVNIALANEFAILSDEIGVNIWEARELANKHPRVDILQPGPGVGGHCISVDPWFLTERSVNATLITTAREINDNMPSYIFLQVKKIFENRNIQTPSLAVFGIAYKGNIQDTRETPALKFIKLCEREGWDVRVYDPHVKMFDYPLVSLSKATDTCDCIIIFADHREFSTIDPRNLNVRHRILIDTRNILDKQKWKNAGFSIKVLGNGRKSDDPP